MIQERLSALSLISIEWNRWNIRRSLNMEDIVTAFAVAKVRKLHF